MISKNELFDFLIDIVPREEATKTHKKKESVSEVQYIVTLPTSTGMGNTIQLPSLSYSFISKLFNLFYYFRWSNYSITSKFIVKHCYNGSKLIIKISKNNIDM